MSEVKWEEERTQLLERLKEAEQSEQKWRQIAAESQAEAAVCRDLLEDFYKAARQALDSKEISLLPRIADTFSYLPTESDTKEWGKYFLRAYMRDAGWLEDTKKALERIKLEAEKLSADDNATNAELKKRIINAAEEGLITHI